MSRTTDNRTKLLSLVLVGLMVLSMFAGPASAALATSEATDVSSVGGAASPGVNPADIRGTVTDGPVEPAAVNDTQKINTTDRISVWERSPLTLRPDITFGSPTIDAIAGEVNNTRTFIEADFASTSLSKDTLYVYERQTIRATFDPNIVGDSDVIDGERTQVVAVRLKEGSESPGSVEDIGDFITSSEDTDARIVSNTTGVNGDQTFEFTPEQSGQHILATVLVENSSESGLVPAESGNLTAESNVTVVGFDQFLVREGSSTISPPDVAAAGNTVSIDVDASGLETDEVLSLIHI